MAQDMITHNPHSTASIAGHPIHAMFVPFPIAFFVATFVCDLIFWRTGNTAWATGSLWLLGAGLVMAALAALAGLADVLGDVQIRSLQDLWLHAGGNVFVVVIELYNWYSRYVHAEAAVVPIGLVLSLAVVLILMFTGWKGWGMVYRHHVGVVFFTGTAGELADPATVGAFYFAAAEGEEYLWAFWRLGSLEELVATWPTRTPPEQAERARGWWRPTLDELRIARRDAKSRRRAKPRKRTDNSSGERTAESS